MKQPGIMLNVCIMALLLTVLGTLQSMLPGLWFSQLKLPLVVFAGVYWMLFRGPWCAYPGALWAGAAADGLCETNTCAGMWLMLVLCLVVRHLRGVSAWWGTPGGAAVVCGVAGVVMVVLYGVANGAIMAAGWARIGCGVLETGLCAWAAGLALCTGLLALDRWLGTLKVLEVNGFSWSRET